MIHNKNLLCLLTTSLLAVTTASADVSRHDLTRGWQFCNARGGEWSEATVPGTVHTDLMRCGVIADPFLELNEDDVQWVDKEDWIYRTLFDVDSLTLTSSHASLVFEGLDTYADIYLNDSLLLEADNMFRRWELPVGGLLRPEGNILKIHFHSPINRDIPKYDALPFHYEAINDQSEKGGVGKKQVSIFARKAGYHYGWDWGPRLVTSGIWRPVYIEVWDTIRIADTHFRTLALREKEAAMLIDLEVAADRELGDCELTVTDSRSGEQLLQTGVSIQQGDNKLSLPFVVSNPKLWWCNGLGEPSLYDFEVKLARNGIPLASEKRQTGIRQIEVVREEDAEGRSFYFRLNGVPVFAKGANYIPCDNFLPRVTPDIYRKTIQDAADANMNMLRVWGGGIYEDDLFYNLCDSLGIMVWQDFMFACSLYPAEGALLTSIIEEARDNVRRLRNHPSIAIWCGNNECLEAWYKWGWKERYTKQGVVDLIWGQYDTLFHKALPAIVQELSPDVFYWPSSPFSHVEGAPEPNLGDSHMWAVWGSGKPIELYNTTRSRFFSEYGFQSFPELEVVRRYIADSTEHRLDSRTMLAHQRAGEGANRKIEDYLLQSYPKPKDFGSFLYMSQILQGDAIKLAIEAHRRDRPYCMGTLFWQHNDCWPVASWSSRDYYGNWKAQHYFAKKAYRDILLSITASPDSIYAYIVSDRTDSARSTLRLTALTLSGDTIATRSDAVSIGAGEVRTLPISAKELLLDADLPTTFLHALLEADDTTYDNCFFPIAQKELKLEAPEITTEVAEKEGLYVVTIRANTFVRALRLILDGETDYFFSDNYMDILPGRPYTMTLRSSLPLDEVKRQLSWQSLYEATH